MYNNKENNSKLTVGRQQTGNMKTYSKGGINHDGKHENVNHRTHPDQLNHRQLNNFGK